MKNVEILLRDNVTDLGKVGDVVRVRPGYARNFLLPMGLAIHATPENVKLMARRRVRQDAEDAARDAELNAVAEKIAGAHVKTAAKADESGSLYGSVGAAQIAELLTTAGFPTDERSVHLEAPLKNLGDHSVSIHVHGDRNVDVTVSIEAEA